MPKRYFVVEYILHCYTEDTEHYLNMFEDESEAKSFFREKCDEAVVNCHLEHTLFFLDSEGHKIDCKKFSLGQEVQIHEE